MLQLLAHLLNALATLLRTRAPKPNVVLMSRQAATPSLELRMLHDELVTHLGAGRVSYCLTEPETKSTLGFAAGTLRQLVAACRNKVVIADGYSPAISIPKSTGATKVIQVWHAIGAIKQFGYQTLDRPAGRSSSYARVARMHRNYDVIVADGPGSVEAYAQAFGYPREAIRVLGSPTVDFLLAKRAEGLPASARGELAAALPCLANGKRTIVYAPTLRKGPGTAGWVDASLRALASCCDAATTNLVYAGHPLDREVSEPVARHYACLHVACGVSTTELLRAADVVITDYSSIAFQAGLLGTDTCFYVPDIERYRASTGLNIDWLEQGIGLACTSAEELLAHLMPQPDEQARAGFASFRAFVEGYFAGVQPGGTQRIASLACELLES